MLFIDVIRLLDRALFPPALVSISSNGLFNAPPARLLHDAGDASWDVVNRRTAPPRSMGDGQV